MEDRDQKLRRHDRDGPEKILRSHKEHKDHKEHKLAKEHREKHRERDQEHREPYRDRDYQRDRDRDRDAAPAPVVEAPARRLHIVQRGPPSGAGGSGGPPLKILASGAQAAGAAAAAAPEASTGAAARRSGAAQAAACTEPSQAKTSKQRSRFEPQAEAPLFQRCTFMDEDFQICVDEVRPQLAESGSEFTVVAAVGAPGVGKSVALSLLFSAFGDFESGDRGSRSSYYSKAAFTSFRPPLAIRTLEEMLEGYSEPSRIELCVSTLDRLILLELHLSDGYSSSEASSRVDLELLLFVTSICHTVVLVLDGSADTELWRLMRTAVMIKSKMPDLAAWLQSSNGSGRTGGEEKTSLPRLVVAHNGMEHGVAEEALFQPATTYFEHSLWVDAPSMHFVQIPTLEGDDAKALLTSGEARAAGLALRSAVLCGGSERGRFGGDGLSLTEREWLYQVSAYLNFVRKASALNGYFNIMSTGLSHYGLPKF